MFRTLLQHLHEESFLKMGINEQNTREGLSEVPNITDLITLNDMSLKITVDIPQPDTKGNRLNSDLSPT